MVCKDRLEQCLEQAAVPYSFQEHRTVFTAQEVAQTEHIPGHMMAKPVIVNADGNLAMLVLPATEKVDLRKASEVLHAKSMRLASETEFQETFTDCEVGAIPAFGNKTTRYRLTERLPAAIANEFISRTRYRVVSDPAQAAEVRPDRSCFKQAGQMRLSLWTASTAAMEIAVCGSLTPQRDTCTDRSASQT